MRRSCNATSRYSGKKKLNGAFGRSRSHPTTIPKKPARDVDFAVRRVAIVALQFMV